jgi:predicted transcriptional regulator
MNSLEFNYDPVWKARVNGDIAKEHSQRIERKAEEIREEFLKMSEREKEFFADSKYNCR